MRPPNPKKILRDLKRQILKHYQKRMNCVIKAGWARHRVILEETLLSDILPQLKLVGFSLLLPFRLHPSRSGRFCLNPLPSFGVFPALKVAPLEVSVLSLHASLSVCNRDMSSTRFSAQATEWRHFQPHGEVLSDQSLHGDFHARLSHVSTGVVSCLNLNAIAIYI